jgi:exosortase
MVPLAVLAVLFLAAYLPSLRWLVERWSMGVWYHSHGFLVPPLAAWLAWGALREYDGGPPRASAWGFAFLAPAMLLLAIDAVLRFEIVAAVSLVVALPGLSLLLLGRERTKALWFPLAFLGFAIPIPLVVARPMFVFLRRIAAVGTEHGMRLLGFDVFREGTLIHFDHHSIAIADPCSGFSTLLALTMFAALLAHTSVRRWWKIVLLLLLAFPIAAFANVLRCIGLAILIGVYGNGILGTWIHPGTGIAAFLVALPLLLLTVDLLGSRKGVAA